MKLLLVGGSGLVGQQVLRLALADPAVSGLVAPTRRALASAAKLENPLVDFERLRLPPPRVVRDLPAGGRRLLQGAEGYLATLVAGQVVQMNGRLTEARPGRLVRAG